MIAERTNNSKDSKDTRLDQGWTEVLVRCPLFEQICLFVGMLIIFGKYR